MVSGTRSDLVVHQEWDTPILLEVVVSHWPESPTLRAYEESGYPVYIKSFRGFGDLENLGGEFFANEVINLPSICPHCETIRLEEEKRFERRRGIIDRALSRLMRKPSNKILFSPWYYGKPRDGFDTLTPMFPKTQWPVFANALILAEMEFQQSNPQKPWLFLYQLPKGVRLYADLGSSDVVPIYEDTAAMLYCFLPGEEEELQDFEESHRIKQYLVSSAGQILQDASVNARTGFLSPEELERRDVGPLQHVDKRKLSPLVKKLPG